MAGGLTAQDLERYPQLLPNNVIELITLIGATATADLLNHYGGSHLIVRAGRTDGARRRNSEIAAVIGEKAANKLIEAFGSYKISPYIPSCTILKSAIRKQRVIEQFDRLTTGSNAITGERAIKAIGRELGLSSRHVYRLLNNKKGRRPPPLKCLAVFPDFDSAAEFASKNALDDGDLFRLLVDDTAEDGSCAVYCLNKPNRDCESP